MLSPESLELPVLLVNDGVLLPDAQIKLPIRSKANFLLIESCLLSGNIYKKVALIYRTETAKNERKLCKYCTIAEVGQVSSWALTNGSVAQYTLHLKGIARGEVLKFGAPLSTVRVLPDTDTVYDENLLTEFMESLLIYISLSQSSLDRDSLRGMIAGRDKQFNKMVDLAVSSLRDLPYDDQLAFLSEQSASKRMSMANGFVKELIKSKFLKEHSPGVISRMGTTEHKALSPKRHRLSDLEQLQVDFQKIGLPEGVVKETIMEDLDRLKSLSPASQDYHVLLSYLKLVANLPWSHMSEDLCDLEKSRDILNAEHEGMTEVKKRVLEFLAVKQLKNQLNGPILCLVGPPGVGKTSIAKAVAETLGRNFQRIALGGIRDQSNIRGHRRTYVGAMPGRIIQAMKLAKTKNPVILLDEIDKLVSSAVVAGMFKGVGPQGDPAAALLEVLDPAQNHTFQDLYLNLPFDLSKVVFIATANDATNIPTPLLDRMELIEMPSYSAEQKFQIATKHIIPRQLQKHALTPEYLTVEPDAIHKIIEEYTREAGVRQLERTIGAVCRWAAVGVAKAINGGSVETDTVSTDYILPLVVKPEDLKKILGKEKFSRSKSLLRHAARHSGVALGLAWTPVGGEVLVIETVLSEGKGEIVFTGKLGKVIKESIQVAISWLRSKAQFYNLDFSNFKNSDLHIHLPAGAVAKDGPSAGCAFTLALFSLITGRRVRGDSACTGEVTLTGKVLPVGGIKEKVLAAHRSGIHRVALPAENQKDVAELDANILDQMEIIFVGRVEELIDRMVEPLAIIAAKL